MPADSPLRPEWPAPNGLLLSLQQAQERVAECSSRILLAPPGQQSCKLEHALGHVLACSLDADRDQPPFPRVTRDGFAVRAADLAGGTPLRLVGGLKAGELWPPTRPSLRAGEACEVMTGAALPPGADAVLMVEHAEQVAAGTLRLQPGRALLAGDNVVAKGSESREGGILLEAGTRLGPEEIALAAACGRRSVSVYQPPAVAILATGDELVEPLNASGPEPAEPPIASHLIYDSNSRSLAALVQQAHAIPLRQPVASDRSDELAAAIRHGFDAAPLLLISGGVSMGRYDLVEPVLASIGAEFFFTGVKMQPGKPVVFGRVPENGNRPERFFFGLPGNPVSAMVTFRVFVLPLLAALAGEKYWQPRIAQATLASQLAHKSGLTRFVPAYLDTRQPIPTAAPVRSQGSGDLAANARANCYIIVPEDCEPLRSGQTVAVLLR